MYPCWLIYYIIRMFNDMLWIVHIKIYPGIPICVYIRICSYVYVHGHTYVYAYIYIYVHIHVYLHMYTHIYIYIYICIYIYIYAIHVKVYQNSMIDAYVYPKFPTTIWVNHIEGCTLICAYIRHWGVEVWSKFLPNYDIGGVEVWSELRPNFDTRHVETSTKLRSNFDKFRHPQCRSLAGVCTIYA